MNCECKDCRKKEYAQVVINQVVYHHHLNKKELLSPKRHKPLVNARRIIAKKLKNSEFAFTLMEIAQLLHRIDHTTVINLLK